MGFPIFLSRYFGSISLNSNTYGERSRNILLTLKYVTTTFILLSKKQTFLYSNLHTLLSTFIQFSSYSTLIQNVKICMINWAKVGKLNKCMTLRSHKRKNSWFMMFVKWLIWWLLMTLDESLDDSLDDFWLWLFDIFFCISIESVLCF